MMMMRRLWIAAGAVLLAVVALAVVVTVSRDGSGSRRDSASQADREEAERDAERPNGYFEPRKEAKFERAHGREADRKGPDSPTAEQVDNRAFPRTYVDDKLARNSLREFVAKTLQPTPTEFKTAPRYREAVAATAGAWSALGPVTANVPGEASQFFNPDTLTGPSTQESGRVTAMAIDPNCGKRSAPDGARCRLWVAAAGGGIWRTKNALAPKPAWIAPPSGLPTNAFGSLVVDPNDARGDTLYAGSGEPNGSSDSEAGLGLFKSTNGGQSWSLVPGSDDVAINRSIGAIAIRPGHPKTIVIGTAVARHGSSSVNGGRRTPPNGPALGFYKSTDGGTHFAVSTDLQGKTPPNPSSPAEGADWFQGGFTKIEFDPNDSSTIYAAVIGYGVWRSTDRGAHWSQIFETVNPDDFFGDRTEFDAVKAAAGKTRIYLGDSSDDLGVAQVFRTNDAASIAGSPSGGYDNAGWTELSSSENGTNGYLAYNYCQNGQCGYDDFVVSPASQPGVGTGFGKEVWLGGSMNYDELPAYAGEPPRSNGRAVMRSTNATAAAANVTWADMSATLEAGPGYGFRKGIHPDQHAVVFASSDPNIAFIGSDGGVVRLNMRDPVDASPACAERRYDYGSGTEEPLQPADLVDCQRALKAIPRVLEPINAGLNSIQFQSLTFNPADQQGDLMGGTQDNGTFSFSGLPTWFESVGGDGGQSGYDRAVTQTRYHNYYDATPEVNFHGTDPTEWLAIYDPLQSSPEQRSFYVPFTADPLVGGRAFVGLEHVWRTNDNGGNQAFLEAHCNALHRDAGPCGDWQPLGNSLTVGSDSDRGGQFVVAVERTSTDAGTVWAATRTGRLWVSKNADIANRFFVRFFRIDTAETPGRFVSGIAIDPNDTNHAWISYSGYGAYTPATPQHVIEANYNPLSHVATFTDRSYDLGDQPVTGIVFDKASGDLYAGTDFGVLRLPAGSTHWLRAGTGLPHVAVYGLTIAQDARVVYAATHGRGAYALELP